MQRPGHCPIEGIAKALELRSSAFPQALLGRLITILYYPLSDDMRQACAAPARCIQKRVAENQVPFTPDDAVVKLSPAAARVSGPDGRRDLDQLALPAISQKYFDAFNGGPTLLRIIGVADGQFSFALI